MFPLTIIFFLIITLVWGYKLINLKSKYFFIFLNMVIYANVQLNIL